MLSQKANDNAATEARTSDSAPSVSAPQGFDADAIQAVMDVFKASPDLQMANDLNEYLTSPLIDSPLDDELLTTPAIGSADMNADILTSPLMGDYGGESFDEFPSLFGDYPAIYPQSKPRHEVALPQPPPLDFDAMYAISPTTPFLDTPDASPFQGGVHRPEPPPPRRKSGANGTRKNITPAALVPIDAPTQARKYVTPSATSRKAVPAVFARKRARSQAFGDEEDQLNEDIVITPSMSEAEQIEAKRRQNTIAARRSRKRKLEYQRELEDNVEQYKRESEIWKSRAVTCQALLRSHNIECPEFPDP
ncbi:hypothetical protein BV22DRAFT_1105423 [Leucogyrophana mollusca]|uniref:Uncharacterized protein n=1 Tax=Leucogyrophana mollusca TaxID=85980 RepID=A0ACB8BI90_9AGAM|nr:hypothetical protein BV22DRAFT_1105423 [Leucogyrophana mollusca]